MLYSHKLLYILWIPTIELAPAISLDAMAFANCHDKNCYMMHKLASVMSKNLRFVVKFLKNCNQFEICSLTVTRGVFCQCNLFCTN